MTVGQLFQGLHRAQQSGRVVMIQFASGISYQGTVLDFQNCGHDLTITLNPNYTFVGFEAEFARDEPLTLEVAPRYVAALVYGGIARPRPQDG